MWFKIIFPGSLDTILGRSGKPPDQLEEPELTVKPKLTKIKFLDKSRMKALGRNYRPTSLCFCIPKFTSSIINNLALLNHTN